MPTEAQEKYFQEQQKYITIEMLKAINHNTSFILENLKTSVNSIGTIAILLTEMSKSIDKLSAKIEEKQK